MGLELSAVITTFGSFVENRQFIPEPSANFSVLFARLHLLIFVPLVMDVAIAFHFFARSISFSLVSFFCTPPGLCSISWGLSVSNALTSTFNRRFSFGGVDCLYMGVVSCRFTDASVAEMIKPYLAEVQLMLIVYFQDSRT